MIGILSVAPYVDQQDLYSRLYRDLGYTTTDKCGKNRRVMAYLSTPPYYTTVYRGATVCSAGLPPELAIEVLLEGGGAYVAPYGDSYACLVVLDIYPNPQLPLLDGLFAADTSVVLVSLGGQQSYRLEGNTLHLDGGTGMALSARKYSALTVLQSRTPRMHLVYGRLEM